MTNRINNQQIMYLISGLCFFVNHLLFLLSTELVHEAIALGQSLSDMTNYCISSCLHMTMHYFFFIKTTLTAFSNNSTENDPDGFRWYMYDGVSEYCFTFCTIMTISRQKGTQSREDAPILSKDFKCFFYSAKYNRTVRSISSNSLEHCRCTTSMTNIQPGRDSRTCRVSSHSWLE